MLFYENGIAPLHNEIVVTVTLSQTIWWQSSYTSTTTCNSLA